jgi:hypothetical protein
MASQITNTSLLLTSARQTPNQDLDYIRGHILSKIIQDDQKVSVHLMITIQKVTSNVQSAPASLQTFIDTRLTLTPSVIPNSNYVIMVSE